MSSLGYVTRRADGLLAQLDFEQGALLLQHWCWNACRALAAQVVLVGSPNSFPICFKNLNVSGGKSSMRKKKKDPILSRFLWLSLACF